MLTTITMLALAALARGAPQSGKPGGDHDPDLKEIRHYTLTMDKVQKLAAGMEAVNKMLAADPSLKKRMDDSAKAEQDKPIDQRAKDLDANFPQLTAAIHRNGLTTREFVVISMAFMNDVMMVGMKKQGSIKEYPPDMITPENAAFVEQNFDKLQGLAGKMTPPDDNR